MTILKVKIKKNKTKLSLFVLINFEHVKQAKEIYICTLKILSRNLEKFKL